MAEGGGPGWVRRGANAVLRRVGNSGAGDRAFESVVGWVDGASRAEIAYRVLASLAPDERLTVARRLCASTRGVCAARAGDLVTACLEGAPAEVFEETYRAISDQALRDPHTLEYALSVTRAWLHQLERLGIDLEGKRVLELGPGYTLAGGIALHCHGAATWTGADLFPLVSGASAVYRLLRARLAERPLVADPAAAARALARFDVAVDVRGPEVSFPTGVVVHRHPVDAARLPFPDGAFDIVLSNACFEHIRDPGAAVREAARVTAKGGHGLHVIDLRDHRDFSRPLEFLTVTQAAWEASFAAGQFEYTNRLRRRELEALFRAADQEIVNLEVTGRCPVDDALRARLQPPYRDLEHDELSAVGCLFAVRRPQV